MAFIQINSDNPNVSYVLGKNPASGMLVRGIRKGKAFGYYSDDTTFNVYFKDSDTEVSYKSHENEQFEYVNKTRYNSSLVILNIISEFFAKTVKQQHEHDKEGHLNKLTINMLHVSSPKVFELAEHIEGFDVVTNEVAKNNYKIEISTNKSIRHLLNFVNIFCLYSALKNTRDFVDLGNSAIEKYLGCLELIDPPYFVRNIFKINVLQSRGKLDKYRELLENTNQHEDIHLTFGNTAYARRDWLKSMLGTPKKDIVDVGCGEGFYVFDLARKMEDSTYHAVDIDEEARRIVTDKAKKRQAENIKVYDNVNKLENLNDKDVLFMEVMEHMEYDNALNLTKNILNKNPERVFLSTPNKTFNKYYFNEDEFRHDDHKFELTKPEFMKFLFNVCPENYSFQVFPIGDRVDGISTTMGAIFTKDSV